MPPCFDSMAAGDVALEPPATGFKVCSWWRGCHFPACKAGRDVQVKAAVPSLSHLTRLEPNVCQRDTTCEPRARDKAAVFIDERGQGKQIAKRVCTFYVCCTVAVSVASPNSCYVFFSLAFCHKGWFE